MLEAQSWQRRIQERGRKGPMSPQERATQLALLDKKLKESRGEHR